MRTGHVGDGAFWQRLTRLESRPFRINHWCEPGIRGNKDICEVANSVNQQTATIAVNIAAKRRAARLFKIRWLILSGENPVASGLQADNIA
jgi:hypothetical protein